MNEYLFRGMYISVFRNRDTYKLVLFQKLPTTKN